MSDVFLRMIWLFHLKSVFLWVQNSLKSVFFEGQNLLKSVNSNVVPILTHPPVVSYSALTSAGIKPIAFLFLPRQTVKYVHILQVINPTVSTAKIAILFQIQAR